MLCDPVTGALLPTDCIISDTLCVVMDTAENVVVSSLRSGEQ